MRQVTGFVILMGASAFIACAAQTPSTSTPPPAPAASTSAAQAPAASTSSTASASTTTTASATSTGTAPPAKIPSGYRKKTVNGTDLYCRTDPVPNSRAQRVETCLTLEQLDARNRASADYIEQVQRTGGLTTGTGGGMPSGGMGR